MFPGASPSRFGNVAAANDYGRSDSNPESSSSPWRQSRNSNVLTSPQSEATTLSPTLTNTSLPDQDDPSDDLMDLVERKIAACVLLDDAHLELSQMGLEFLPDKISELQYISRIERKSSGGGSGDRGSGTPYKTPPHSPPSRIGQLTTRSPLLAAGRRERPWARSASLPSAMLPEPLPGSPDSPKSPFGPLLGAFKSLPDTMGPSSHTGVGSSRSREFYSNPLGLGPPPSSRSGKYDEFYPPGSPIVERPAATQKEIRSELDSDLVTAMSAKRTLTAPSGSKHRVRFGGESSSQGTHEPSLNESRALLGQHTLPVGQSSRAAEPHASTSRVLDMSPDSSPTCLVKQKTSLSNRQATKPLSTAKSLSDVMFSASSRPGEYTRSSRTMKRTPSGVYVATEETSWSGQGGSDLALYLNTNAIKW